MYMPIGLTNFENIIKEMNIMHLFALHHNIALILPWWHWSLLLTKILTKIYTGLFFSCMIHKYTYIYTIILDVVFDDSVNPLSLRYQLLFSWWSSGLTSNRFELISIWYARKEKRHSGLEKMIRKIVIVVMEMEM